ncbi:MAG: TrmJ/YjtD family RNA methyltransferase [Candidatus Acidiferrales bacterium]
MPIPRELDRLRIVLVSTRNPLNIGAAARAMSNFGCARLRVVNPYEPAFREARSAVGGSEILARAQEFNSVADAVADCSLVVGTTAVRHRDLQHTLRRLEPAGRLMRKRLASSPVALLFGSEKTGLSNEDLSHCHWLLNIPTSEENISLNLGQAVAVCLYELVRDPKAARRADKAKLASAAEFERITGLLLEVLRTSGYIDLRRVADVDERIRRLVRRANLPARDTDLWLGMLRQILWKVKSGKHSTD